MPDRIYNYVPLWGEWEIDSFIGEGSYGRVYKAVKLSEGNRQISAVKIIHIPVSEEHVLSLRRNEMDDNEIRSFYSGIAEKCVSDIINIGSKKGLANIAGAEDCAVFEDESGFGWDILIRTEYLMPLKKYIAETEITVRDVVKIGQDISNAAAQLNKLNVIHSDIKPENIFVSQFGSFKLADYGIAKNLRKILASGINELNTYYMAPELYNRNIASPSSDIYSLSVLMYRLLNKNRIPFMPDYPNQAEPSDRDEAVRKRMNGEFIPLLSSDTGRKLSDTLAAALSFDSSARFKSAEEFKEELTKIALFEPGLDKVCFLGSGSSLYEYRSSAAMRSAAGGYQEADADYPLIRSLSEETSEEAVIIQDAEPDDAEAAAMQNQDEDIIDEKDIVLNSSDMNGIFAGISGEAVSDEDAEAVFELLKPQEVLSAAGPNADFSNVPFGFAETEQAEELGHDHSDTAERQYYGLFSDKSNEEDESTVSGTDSDQPDSDMEFGETEIHPADDKVADLDYTESSDKDSGDNEDNFGEDIQKEDIVIDYAEEIEFSSPFGSEPGLVFEGSFEDIIDSEGEQTEANEDIKAEELRIQKEISDDSADEYEETDSLTEENAEQAAVYEDEQPEELLQYEEVPADDADAQEETDSITEEKEEDTEETEQTAVSEEIQPEELLQYEEIPAGASDEQEYENDFVPEENEDTAEQTDSETAETESDEYQEEETDTLLPVFEPEVAEIPTLDQLESENFISSIPTLNTGILDEIIIADDTAGADEAQLDDTAAENAVQDDEGKSEGFDIESSLDLLKLSELYSSVPSTDEYDFFTLAEEAEDKAVIAESEAEPSEETADAAGVTEEKTDAADTGESGQQETAEEEPAAEAENIAVQTEAEETVSAADAETDESEAEEITAESAAETDENEEEETAAAAAAEINDTAAEETSAEADAETSETAEEAELTAAAADETAQTESEEPAAETQHRKPFRKSKSKKNSADDGSQIEDLDSVFDIKSSEIGSLTESEEEIMFGQYFNRAELSFEKVSADALFSEQTDQEANEIFASANESQQKISDESQANDSDDEYPAFGLFSANGTSFVRSETDEDPPELIQSSAEEEDTRSAEHETYADKEVPQEDSAENAEHKEDESVTDEEKINSSRQSGSDEESAQEAADEFTEDDSKHAKKRFYRKNQEEETADEFAEDESMHFSGDEPADDGSLLSKIKRKVYDLRSSPNLGNIIKLAVASVVLLGGLIVFTVSYRQKVNNYNMAVGYYQTGNFVESKKILEKMVTFKDSSDLLQKCDQSLEVQYNHAMGLMVSKNYNEAAEGFEKISGYSDASKQAIICKNRALYEEGEAFFREGKFSEAYLKFKELSIRGFEDSAARAEQCVSARPETHFTFSSTTYNVNGRSVINIVNPAANKCDIFVKILSANGDLILTAYVREGESQAINITEGSYKVNSAFGTKWFGNNGLFGSDKFGDLASYYSYTSGEGNELVTLVFGQNFEMNLKRPDDNDSVLKKIEPEAF